MSKLFVSHEVLESLKRSGKIINLSDYIQVPELFSTFVSMGINLSDYLYSWRSGNNIYIFTEEPRFLLIQSGSRKRKKDLNGYYTFVDVAELRTACSGTWTIDKKGYFRKGQFLGIKLHRELLDETNKYNDISNKFDVHHCNGIRSINLSKNLIGLDRVNHKLLEAELKKFTKYFEDLTDNGTIFISDLEGFRRLIEYLRQWL